MNCGYLMPFQVRDIFSFLVRSGIERRDLVLKNNALAGRRDGERSDVTKGSRSQSDWYITNAST
jgi:hypothetical protein